MLQDHKPRTLFPQYPLHLSRLAMDNDFDNALREYKDKIDIKTRKTEALNIIIREKQTHMDLVRYLHASWFSPLPFIF